MPGIVDVYSRVKPLDTWPGPGYRSKLLGVINKEEKE